MEIGAVKQAFNNEVIHLKSKLNQARIQVIHKLTRKAKVLLEKKAPEKLQEKLKRKAESAVKEVMILKKIKPKDLAKFAVTHTGELKTYLNRPNADLEKACARLLLHKALEDKYTHIRNMYSNVPIDDLLMSRIERRNLKKEEKDKQKNKKKEKQSRTKNNSISSEGDWTVEDIKSEKDALVKRNGDDDLGDESDSLEHDNRSAHESEASDKEDIDDDDESSEKNGDDQEAGESSDESVHSEGNDDSENEDSENENGQSSDNHNENETSEEEMNNDEGIKQNIESKVSKKHIEQESKFKQNKKEHQRPAKEDNRIKLPKINKDKSKKQVEKIVSKKFKKGQDETLCPGNKVVDPFFITATGDNYMSVAEPRAPDEVKEVHRQGNRQFRRAAMFGHEVKFKPRSYNNRNEDNNGFNRNNRFDKNSERKSFDRRNDRNNFDKGNKWRNNEESNNGSYKRNNIFDKQNNSSEFDNRNRFKSFDGKSDFKNNLCNNKEEKISVPEKLHPSWEAKRKISSILPFQGKKIKFDEG